MLRQAGAPEPWARPDSLPTLASTLDDAAALRPGIPVSPEVETRRKAQAAIVTLRRLLPELAAWSVYNGRNPTLLSGAHTPKGLVEHQKKYAAQAVAEMALHEALFDVHRPIPASMLPVKPSNRSHWHFAAAGLWLIYRSVVGQAGKSQHGPAARFVSLALARAGYGQRDTAAIEKALARHWLTTNQRK